MGSSDATKPSEKTVLADAMTDAENIDFEIIELFFFAYRDFISDPDAILSDYGFGRAHHRVLHFVNREPGLTVAALLDILKITKQSLARVLKQLVESGYIHQLAGPEDRRQRQLYPTRKGRELSLALARPQSRRIARAFSGLDEPARQTLVRFLAQMIDHGQRNPLSPVGPANEGPHETGLPGRSSKGEYV